MSFEVTAHDAPVALIAELGLGPRPSPDGPPVRLAPGAMAILIGRRQAHGHGLPPDRAAALQRRLDGGVRHWAVRIGRREVEVVDGDGGIWQVTRAGPDLVELTATTTTAVVRALVALVPRPARDEARRFRGR